MKNYNKITGIIILLIFFVSSFLQAQQGGIKGKITDGVNPLPFVNIIILETN
jgi:hypothetical protein